MKFHRLLAPSLLALGVAGLSACGSGSDDSVSLTPPPATPMSTVSGVAAVGAPIVGGAVSLKCGASNGASTTSGSNGGWSTSVPTAALPCAVRISGGTVAGAANATVFYSLAKAGSASTANLTPISDLALAAAVNSAVGSVLDAWFASATDAQRQQVADGLATAIAQLRSALADAGYTLPTGSFDPFTASIVAGGATDLYDQLLEAYRQALDDAGRSYETARSGYIGGAGVTAPMDPEEPEPPVSTPLPDDKLGVSFDDASAAHLWLQPDGQGGISVLDGQGDGQVILGMGDRTDGGPDGTVQFNVSPNKLGTYACGDAIGNSRLHLQVTFNGITNPRKTYVSFGDAADPAQRPLLEGYSCSLTLTHVGAFESRYIYNDDYIEGRFTAKLRQRSPDCAGEGNCEPYKELVIRNGKFRINKSGRYTPPEPPAAAKSVLGPMLKRTIAGDYLLKCSTSQGQPSQGFSFSVAQDGSSTFNGAPLVDATHPGTVKSDGDQTSFTTLSFMPAGSNSDYVVLGFKADGTFYPNSVRSNGSVYQCYFNTGHTAPATTSAAIDNIPVAAGNLARTQTVNCTQAGATSARTLTIASDGSAQLGDLAFTKAQLFTISDGLLFATVKKATLTWSQPSAFRTLLVEVDADLKTTAVIAGVGLGPNDAISCTP